MASKFMKQGDVIEMAVTYFPSFLRSRMQAVQLDRWMNGNQQLNNDDNDVEPDAATFGLAFSPREDTDEEFENLRGLSPNNFAGLVVASVAQTAYIEGMRRPGVKGQLPVWQTFRRNKWLSRQSAIHRTAIGQSTAYGVVLPGTDPLTGDKMSKMLMRSGKTMAAFYDNDDDEWPRLAIEAYPKLDRTPMGVIQTGWTVAIYDAYVVHRLETKSVKGGEASEWTYITHDEHGIPVPPVARCVNRMDLEGRAYGEIEPILPLLRRIDQDLFDRLIVQRFGAWQVRYISGMAKPSNKSDALKQAIKLRQEDMLISTNKDTKFGVLPGSPLAPHIEATDADLRLLSAISQTPPHHLLGLSSNLQAEALAAAESGLQRKGFDFRNNAGEFHEQMARLVALAEGDLQTAAAWDLQVRWKDTESRSQAQAAQALGQLATTLKVPIEMLWERIPGWTDDDVQRAKELIEDGEFAKLLASLEEETNQGDAATPSTGSTGGSDN